MSIYMMIYTCGFYPDFTGFYPRLYFDDDYVATSPYGRTYREIAYGLNWYYELPLS